MEVKFTVRKRKSLVLLLALMFSIVFSTNICAVSPIEATGNQVITPNWVAMLKPDQSFSITGDIAYLTAETLADTNASSVYVSASLQRYKGGAWVTIKSWSKTQNGSYVSLSESLYVSSGYTYRLVTNHTTYFSGESESVTLTSKTIGL